MRFIDRSKLSPPAILFDKRAEDERRQVLAFIEQTYSKGGTRRVPRPDWLDADPGFRKEMAGLFNGLCAYCESPAGIEPEMVKSSGPGSSGMVRRHRPHALAQDEDGNTELLAYCWLMYDWDNLLWVCPECARRKGNLFFVEGKRGQPVMPIGELREVEQELLLDPCFHDPRAHLDFLPDGRVNWTSPQGHATTEVLDLNREDLVKARQKAVLDLAGALAADRAAAADGLLFDAALSAPDAHAGSATAAILAHAASRDLPQDGPEAFLSAFADLDAGARAEFVNALVGDTDMTLIRSVDFMPEPKLSILMDEITLPPKARPRSRIPDIRNLPNASKPITRVEIDNFKALRGIAFDLPASVTDSGQSPCMLLLGENATGKSSVLEAMALAVIGASEAAALDALLPGEDLSPAGLIHRPDMHDWATTAPDMRITLDFLDSDNPWTLTAQAGDTTFSGSQDCARVVLGYGPRRYFTSRRTRRLRAPAHRVRSLFDPMDMIANPIHWLSSLDEPQFFAAARALREVLMLSDDDDFERDDDPDTPGSIFIRQNGQRIAMKDMSVGYKSVIAMVSDIIRELLYHFDNLEYAAAVVFIDEIETHLHPRWKMRIMTLLRRAFPQVQFVVTTHDPLCLRGMYDGEVFVLQRAADTDRVEQVADLPSIRGMRAEQILTSEFFGLGSTDPETDARLARYNALAARIETLTEAERAELDRLRQALDEDMVIGSTLREQAYAEALKERVEKRSVAPTTAPSPRRAELKDRFSSLFDRKGGP
ncbi:AAA family ATPase [Thetidibacter halocola]|uniref:AAA family ATPase n=1 Tax=Thetidibacter halocola TaxID=2827239 RepID=A0A8J7WDE7_9RHOB|nr:AAA family ATPase [Thetidibacter halocola]MBS0124707.1 AAA family ATPase [Thetidibacter halocola]